jgi:hypothetical protein
MEDEAARALALSALTPGETLLWSEGAPWQPLVAWSTTVIVISILVVCLTLWIRFRVLPSQPPLTFPMSWLSGLIGIVWIGVWFVAGFANALALTEAGSTAYAVTDRRVMIVTPSFSTDYGAGAFAEYAIDGGTLFFDWGTEGRRTRFRAEMHDLEDPESVAALITEHIAPNAQRTN